MHITMISWYIYYRRDFGSYYTSTMVSKSEISCRGSWHLSDPLKTPFFEVWEQIMVHYLTRLVQSRSQILESWSCLVCELSGLDLGIFWTDFYANSGYVYGPLLVFFFWQRYCEQSVRPSMPIRIPSQIAVDCKSVHLHSNTPEIMCQWVQIVTNIFA